MKVFDGVNFALVNYNTNSDEGFLIRFASIIIVLLLILLNHVPLLTTSNSKIQLKMLYTMLFVLVIPKGLITSSGFKFITDLMKL